MKWHVVKRGDGEDDAGVAYQIVRQIGRSRNSLYR